MIPQYRRGELKKQPEIRTKEQNKNVPQHLRKFKKKRQQKNVLN